ncbi:hypothetical protein D5018_11645 [Parashewanella curva]|uniref:Outer membrane protein beta-barrel domain-containing protein n=1 Tax=Parashewanella curva TaxID=2338552 RepID=A0A3L8PW07_9GAMM|nr:hypothetical protein [Parashewanella curva]RLV59516.1 hypothetical protein D5018_11645 [Parashewanella curva]
MKLFKLALLPLALGLSFNAIADEKKSILSNSNVYAGYAMIDTSGLDPKGMTIGGGYQWDNGYYVSADYLDLKVTAFRRDVDTTFLNAVVGKQFEINESSVIDLDAGWQKAEAKVGSVKVDDSAFVITAKYKVEVVDGWMLKIGGKHTDGDTLLVAGTDYMFTNGFGLGFDLETKSGNSLMKFKASYRF